MNKKQLRGFSLLELLLVLLVIIMVAIASYTRYKYYHQQEAIAALKQNVILLQDGLNNYYKGPNNDLGKDPECNIKAVSSSTVNPHVVTPLQDMLLNTSLVENASGYEAEVLKGFELKGGFDSSRACDPTNPHYAHKLKISVVLKLKKSTPEVMQWYVNKLGASGYELNPATVYWIRLPSYSIPGLQDDLWIMGASLEIFKREIPVVS